MPSHTIPFEIPEKFLAAWSNGTLEQVGAVLKNVDSGKIVAHLQEANIPSQASAAFASGPVGLAVSTASQAAGLIQNHQMGKQLKAIQGQLGMMQSLQVLTAVSSVVSIGVTVASTAIILSKFRAVEGTLSRIEKTVEKLPSQWRDLELRKTIEKIETQLERLEEVPARKDAKPVLQKVEEELHSGFNALHSGVRQVVAEVEIDAELLQALLEALAVSGSAQFKALYQMDDTETALQRAKTQSAKMQTLAFEMPKDKLIRRIVGDATVATEIASQASEIRLIMASRPSLTENLISRNISGIQYLNALEDEQECPLLLLPTI